jgi:hypothetical protein
MAFLLYETSKRNGHLEYRQIEDVRLAGGGLIQSTCKKYLGDDDAGWTISADDMLKAGHYQPANHALVIDIAPNRPNRVNLFEIKAISGYSFCNWTPLMLTLEELFANLPSKHEEKIKRRFSDAKCNRCVVREFLYLSGGYAEGNWNWGGNSRTTAALLWPEAWDYFSKQFKPDHAQAAKAAG